MIINNGLRTEFNSRLGNTLLKTAIWGIPYDTGNLASSVKMAINLPTLKKLTIGGHEADYARSVQDRGKSAGYVDDIASAMIKDIAHYFTTGDSVAGANFSWSKTMYDVSQAKGVGSLGQRGTRFLVGLSRRNGETRRQRRNKSLSRSSMATFNSQKLRKNRYVKGLE